MTEDRLFKRELTGKLLKWMDRKEIFVIKGPRQSGKSTLLKMLSQHLLKQGVDKKHIVYLNFEDRDILEAFLKSPKTYIQSYIVDKKRHFFLIDEYQYAPDGGQKLKLLFDLFENIKFIVTGSSSLEISFSLGKYLVGRVFLFELLPMSFYEFLLVKNERLAKIYSEYNSQISSFLAGKNFKIDKDVFGAEFQPFFEDYLKFGGYPEVVKAKELETKQMILKNIYETYISKDVIELLKISDALKYRSFVKNLAARSVNLINYNELASSCQSNYKEIKKWVSVLNETYIIRLLHPFYKSKTRELRKIPKVYFYDLGLRNYLLNNFNPLEQRSDAGALAENFVLLGLMRNWDLPINFWRTTGGAEVDFVLDDRLPVEAKLSPENKLTRSLHSFIETYKPKSVLITTRGDFKESMENGSSVMFVPIYYM